MGYSLSWVAIKGKSPEKIRHELGFELSGEREDLPESDFSAAELPGNWYLIVSNHSERVVSDEIMKALSINCELVTCYVEEHVMCSQATGWKDGQQLWSITHDVQKSARHLEAVGALPESFKFHRDNLSQRQSEADQQYKDEEHGVDHIFDVPVETARSLTGFRHDEDIENAGEKPFEVLVKKKKPSFLKRFLGR